MTYEERCVYLEELWWHLVFHFKGMQNVVDWLENKTPLFSGQAPADLLCSVSGRAQLMTYARSVGPTWPRHPGGNYE